MKKTFKKHYRAVLSVIVVFCMLLAVFPPIGVAADEVTGYENGTIVYLKNVATNGYLNLSRANDANGANVNIFEFDGTPEERWKLRYDTTDDCYRIGSYVSSSGNNRVVDVKRGGAAPKHGCNVQLYTATDDTSQEWVFYYYGDGKYYISLRASLGLALTASTVKSSAGTYNGTPTGTSTTSPGNVYLGSLPGYDANGTDVGGAGSTIPNNQLWVIEEVNPEKTINEGIYTIRNMASNKMMDATSAGDVVSWGSHGGNNQKWKVTYNTDGFYTLSPMSNLDQLLCIESGSSDELNGDIVVENYSAQTSERGKWKIIPNATGTGYRITCKAGYYAHAATVLYGSTVSGADVVQVEYCNAESQQWVFTQAEKDAIIIVPGVMGSELVAGPNNSVYSEGTKLWSYPMIAEFQSSLDNSLNVINRVLSLKCNNDGSSRDDIIAYNNLYGAGDMYKPLYQSISSAYDDQYNIEFFAYDWRLSNEISAESLDDFIRESGYTKVILVAHSMGGLVSSSYLALGDTQQFITEKLLVVGSPLLGTPAMPLLWGTENVSSLEIFEISDFVDAMLDIVASYTNIMDGFMCNFSSLYELFPTEKYFDSNYAGRSYLTTTIVGAYPLEITTYSDTRNRLESHLPHFNATLADEAEAFHNSLYVPGEHITNQDTTFYIYGTNVSTTDGIIYNTESWTRAEPTSDGDGTVPKWSATLGERYSNRCYPIEDANHMQLIDGNEAKTLINTLI